LLTCRQPRSKFPGVPFTVEKHREDEGEGREMSQRPTEVSDKGKGRSRANSGTTSPPSLRFRRCREIYSGDMMRSSFLVTYNLQLIYSDLLKVFNSRIKPESTIIS
jgi:hypothetical protein